MQPYIKKVKGIGEWERWYRYSGEPKFLTQSSQRETSLSQERMRQLLFKNWVEFVHGYIHWFSSAHQASLISQGNGTRTHKTTVTTAGATGVYGRTGSMLIRRRFENHNLPGLGKEMWSWGNSACNQRPSFHGMGLNDNDEPWHMLPSFLTFQIERMFLL